VIKNSNYCEEIVDHRHATVLRDCQSTRHIDSSSLTVWLRGTISSSLNRRTSPGGQAFTLATLRPHRLHAILMIVSERAYCSSLGGVAQSLSWRCCGDNVTLGWIDGFISVIHSLWVPVNPSRRPQELHTFPFDSESNSMKAGGVFSGRHPQLASETSVSQRNGGRPRKST
jgi:hypothetical protein